MAQTLTLAMSERLLRAQKCMLTRVIRKGRTAMHWAAVHNEPSCIEALLKMKANLNMRDEYACFAACCGFKLDLKLYYRYERTPLDFTRGGHGGKRTRMESLAVLDAAGAM